MAVRVQAYCRLEFVCTDREGGGQGIGWGVGIGLFSAFIVTIFGMYERMLKIVYEWK